MRLLTRVYGIWEGLCILCMNDGIQYPFLGNLDDANSSAEV